jgi:trans-aconitate 2-methyltransferase
MPQPSRESPSWDPEQYLKFERERTLPCRDLVARIELPSPTSIIDLGCGPGNSTSVLAENWPSSKLVGLDNSEKMLESARKSGVRADWVLADMSKWVPERPFDLVVSNAALQWLVNQEHQVPRLFMSVSPGGAFAFQVPSGHGEWAKALKEVAESDAWRGRFSPNLVDLRTHDLRFYYDLLSPMSSRVDMWETEYIHVFPGPESIVEWTTGTAVRPMLDRLADEEERRSFVADYSAAVARAYGRGPDGKVLFPFLRRFLVAYR